MSSSAWSAARDREQVAVVFRALNGNRPLTVEEALDFGLDGWNLRCNRCGSYGARWLTGERPGWGSLALCPPDRASLVAERTRHATAMRGLRAVAFEQEPESVAAEAVRAHRKTPKTAKR